MGMGLTKRDDGFEQRWNALSSTRCVMNAAVRHLQAKPLWNQDAIEQIEEPLHKQREHSCGDGAL
jgi:hypothetical protein